MKFGQLINIAIETFFLKNRTKNVVEKIVPDPFWEIEIEHISGPKVLYILF